MVVAAVVGGGGWWLVGVVAASQANAGADVMSKLPLSRAIPRSLSLSLSLSLALGVATTFLVEGKKPACERTHTQLALRGIERERGVG